MAPKPSGHPLWLLYSRAAATRHWTRKTAVITVGVTPTVIPIFHRHPTGMEYALIQGGPTMQKIHIWNIALTVIRFSENNLS